MKHSVLYVFHKKYLTTNYKNSELLNQNIPCFSQNLNFETFETMNCRYLAK